MNRQQLIDTFTSFIDEARINNFEVDGFCSVLLKSDERKAVVCGVNLSHGSLIDSLQNIAILACDEFRKINPKITSKQAFDSLFEYLKETTNENAVCNSHAIYKGQRSDA